MGKIKYLVFLIFVLSCNSRHDILKVENLSGNDTIQNQVIINQIETQLNVMVKGIETFNADTIFSVFANNSEYIRDGHVYPDVNDARNQYKDWFNDPNWVSQKMTFKYKKYSIFGQNFVKLTAIADIIQITKNKGSDKKPWELSYTILWAKTDNKWQIISMHNSWGN